MAKRRPRVRTKRPAAPKNRIAAKAIVTSYAELAERRARLLEEDAAIVKRLEYAHRAFTDAMRAHRELVQRRAEFQFEEQETDHLKQLVELSRPGRQRMRLAGDDD